MSKEGYVLLFINLISIQFQSAGSNNKIIPHQLSQNQIIQDSINYLFSYSLDFRISSLGQCDVNRDIIFIGTAGEIRNRNRI